MNKKGLRSLFLKYQVAIKIVPASKKLYGPFNGCPAVMETIFSWLIMVTHGYFMYMFLYSILMVKNVTIVQRKHG